MPARKKPKQTSYPSFNSVQPSSNSTTSVQTPQRQVKALYDFEAAEDNELSFATGDIITLLDDSDSNWWRGSFNRTTGLFPASFVTYDLETAQPERKPAAEVAPTPQTPMLPRVQIDEEILLKCIQLLEGCDPTGEAPDPPDLAFYEQMSLAQAPLIDTKLAQIDKQHNMLAQIDVAIRDVLANYDNAVQQVQYQMQQSYVAQQPNPYAPHTSAQQMNPMQQQQPMVSHGGQQPQIPPQVPMQQQPNNHHQPPPIDQQQQPQQQFINYQQHH